MGERARALGGSFDAGATADGWRVDARLPVLSAPSSRVRRRRDPRRRRRRSAASCAPGSPASSAPSDGFEVVAECGDGDEVAAAVAEHAPDLVLMDVRMRRMDGVTATRPAQRRRVGPAGARAHDVRRRRRAVGRPRRRRRRVRAQGRLRRGSHRRGPRRRRRRGLARPQGHAARAHRLPHERSPRDSPRLPRSTS